MDRNRDLLNVGTNALTSRYQAALRNLVVTITLGASLVEGSAHPSFGLIKTGEQTFVFCDVLHNAGTIWQFSERNGLSKLLVDEHCHFLFQGADNSIWGTDHEYLPEKATNENTLWKLSPEGEKQIVIPPTTESHLFSGVNFTVDRTGRIYYPFDRRIYHRLPNQVPTLFLDHQFGRIMSMQMDHNENLYVADTYESGGSLFKISPEGVLECLATDLKEKNPTNPPFPEDHFNLLFGIGVSPNGNAFVASSGGRKVTKIAPGKSPTTVFRSKSPWYPVAALEENGILYVMEAGYQSKKGNFGPRLLKVDQGKTNLIVSIETHTE